MQFDKIRTAEKLNSYVNDQIRDHDKYLIFLDEIQHVRSFEKVLASFRATLNCSIFITESNSKLLSGKMATLLVGRCVEFRIMPFSFNESYEYTTALVTINGKKKCFIQVAYYLAGKETIEREFGAFKPISDASPKYVLSLDRFDYSRDGIAHINIVDFLLGKQDINLS